MFILREFFVCLHNKNLTKLKTFLKTSHETPLHWFSHDFGTLRRDLQQNKLNQITNGQNKNLFYPFTYFQIFYLKTFTNYCILKRLVKAILFENTSVVVI